MNDTLQAILRDLIQAGSQSNPAMNALINDYAQYHVVFVVAGALLAVIFGLLTLYFGVKWKRAPRTERRKWTFEKKTYFSFAGLSIGMGLMIALIVAANASNVLDPERGFSQVVDSIITPEVGTPPYTLYQSFNTWLQSDSTAVPPVIQAKLDERTVFHTLKALVCSILLVGFLVLNSNIWRGLISHFRIQGAGWRLKEVRLLLCGVSTVAVSLLLMIIVVANTQAAFASKTLTLIYG